MAEISPAELIAVRQFAVDSAVEIGRYAMNPHGTQGNSDGLLSNAFSIEQFILTGQIVVATAPAPVVPPAIKSRSRKPAK